jgi:hypothetical protein
MTTESEELAPPASVDTAITHRCNAIRGLRCWQYTQGAGAVPAWTQLWTSLMGDGRLEYCDQNGSTGIYFEPGDWLVEFEEDQHAAVYSVEEFSDTFRVVLP